MDSLGLEILTVVCITVVDVWIVVLCWYLLGGDQRFWGILTSLSR
jgi:hypothetical protein